mmetsp:Transcript_13710/g.27369  ORF Transcript_13710/g.27369 Transcript_13710/m.27369 type:complete len:378 (+) Transcript_13710:33-1166(+)
MTTKSSSEAAASIIRGLDQEDTEGFDHEDYDFGKLRKVPLFDSPEIEVGKFLGRGAFSVVREVNSFDLRRSTEKLSDDEIFYRSSMQKGCKRDHNGTDHCRYAVKMLNTELPKDQKILGMTDLSNEAVFLSAISHANIIKMRGMSTSKSESMGFFIVLDRLYDTLEEKVYKWNNKQSGVKKLFTSKKAKHTRLIERLTVAFDLASAIKYLHENNIVHRDVKPDNIGFDVRGDIKLFDFGLAKRILPEKKFDETTYKLTGRTGSLLYMAPEVYNCEPYNSKVDIFSFGIVFWQIIAMESPFPKFNCKMIEELVIGKGYRPKVSDDWIFGKVMKKCWSKKHVERPSAKEACSLLGDFIMQLDGSNDFQERRNSSIAPQK